MIDCSSGFIGLYLRHICPIEAPLTLELAVITVVVASTTAAPRLVDEPPFPGVNFFRVTHMVLSTHPVTLQERTALGRCAP